MGGPRPSSTPGSLSVLSLPTGLGGWSGQLVVLLVCTRIEEGRESAAVTGVLGTCAPSGRTLDRGTMSRCQTSTTRPPHSEGPSSPAWIFTGTTSANATCDERSRRLVARRRERVWADRRCRCERRRCDRLRGGRLDRRHPERAQVREMQAADDYRKMWDTIERLWSDTVAGRDDCPGTPDRSGR